MLGQASLFAPDASLPLRKRVQLEIISATDARFTLEQFHYLHRARVGRQINYAVLIDGVVDGVITYAYPMVSVPIAGVPSDEVLEFARLFLYRNIKNSASCAIGQSLRRIVTDWMRAFPDAKRPRLIVSWSDTTLHSGTIYKASNFEFLKISKGIPTRKTSRRNVAWGATVREYHPDYSHDKFCWIYRVDNAAGK